MTVTRTWILIADASRAHVLTTRGPKTNLERIDEMTLASELPPTHEIVDDRQGRTFDSAGPGRHAYEPHTDPRRALKGDFAQVVAAMLDEQAREKAFDRLVVVAPPTMLGELRTRMSNAVRSMVTAEIDKDLTKIPDGDVARHLADVL